MIARRVLTLLIALCALAACSGASQRRKTIDATLAAVNRARDAFISVDDVAQTTITETATSLEQGKQRLADYYKRRTLVVEAFAAAYRAISLAATSDGDPTIADMVAMAKSLSDTYEEFKKAVNQ